MRKFLTLLFSLISITTIMASSKETAPEFLTNYQYTDFLKIHIDGSKQKYIKALKRKGIEWDNKHDRGLGVLYDRECMIVLHENEEGDLWRVAVASLSTFDADKIKIEYNTMLHYFLTSDNYIQVDTTTYIMDNEDLHFNLAHGVVYESIFMQYEPEDVLLKIAKKPELPVGKILNKKEMNRILNNELEQDFYDIMNDEKSYVWFRILEAIPGEFYICVYFENGKNEPKE